MSHPSSLPTSIPTTTRLLRWRLPGLLRLAGLSVAAWLMSAAPAVQAAESGWRDCAKEGEVCRVANRGVVRYGVPGSWATRSVRGDVLCSNEAFGDPAPNAVKRCEIAGSGGFGGSGGSNGGGFGGSGGSSGGSGGDWVFCAPEGETCRFRGVAEVRFGDGNRFTTRRAAGSVRCDVSDFGDPAYGVTKHCEVPRGTVVTGGGSGGSWGGGNNAWRYCAAEGQSCMVNGRAQVRFGDGQRFATRTVSGAVDCSTGVFGDPAYGQVKHCEVQASAWGGSGGSGGSTAQWTRCAREGERCQFDGRTQVRYGTLGRYYYRDAWGSVACNSGQFGGDPYPNRVKSCEIRR